ncbi:hypothetical protein FSP39_008774, partial [Pinctada imbricata]
LCLLQIPCGNVYVTSSDSVQRVKSSILATNISPDKKKKTSKHALAIGSSFGHVHAFLSDESRVLQELDRKSGEDQCLMLIKKPKSSSRQMLKSQSWTNLSASDSHIYKQDVGHQGESKRHHRFRMKKKPPELKAVPSETSDDSKSVDGSSPRSSSQSDDGGFLRYQENGGSYLRDKENRWASNRAEKSKSEVLTSSHNRIQAGERTRYQRNSGGMAGREINNNSKFRNNGRLYRSQNDIRFYEPPRLVEIPTNDETCTIMSDEMYSPKSEKKTSQSETNEVDNNDMVSRCRSLGDLTTGLTLSVVGQRKSESIQNLPKSMKSLNFSENGHEGQLDNTHNKSDRTSDVFTDERESSPSEGFKNRTKPKICTSTTNLYNPDSLKKSPVQVKTLRSRSWGVLPDKNSSLSLVKSEKDDTDSSQNSSPSTRSNDKTPTNRTRRTLPNVPEGRSSDVMEKKRKYTELMKMRMSANSSNSESCNSRQSVMSPASESQLLSNGEERTPDREVSDFFYSEQTPDGKRKFQNYDNSGKNGKCETSGKRISGSDSLNGDTNFHTLPSGGRSCDSGQTTATSLSSTMDSGYLTTDGETDMYSSTSYTKSLQRSAHTLYSTNYGGVSRRDENLGKVAPTSDSASMKGKTYQTPKGKSVNIGKGADMTSTPVTSPQYSRNPIKNGMAFVKYDSGISDSSFSSITSPHGPTLEENSRVRRREDEIYVENRVNRFPSASQSDVREHPKASLVHRQLSLANPKIGRGNQETFENSVLTSPTRHNYGDIKSNSTASKTELFPATGVDKNVSDLRNNNDASDLEPNVEVHSNNVRNSTDKLSKCNITVLPSTDYSSVTSLSQHNAVPISSFPNMGSSSMSDRTLGSRSKVDLDTKGQRRNEIICDKIVSDDINNRRDMNQTIGQSLPTNTLQNSVPNMVNTSNTEVTQRSEVNPKSQFLEQLPEMVEQVPKLTQQVPANPHKVPGNPHKVPGNPNKVPSYGNQVQVPPCANLTSSVDQEVQYYEQWNQMQNPHVQNQILNARQMQFIGQQVPGLNRPISAVYTSHVGHIPNMTPSYHPATTVFQYGDLSNISSASVPHFNASNGYSTLPKMAIQHLHHDYVNIPSSHMKSGDHMTGSDCHVTGKGVANFGSVQNLHESQRDLTNTESLKSQEHYNTLPGKWKFQNFAANFASSATKYPSIFQMLQTYDFHSLHLRVKDNFNLLDYLTLVEKAIELPNVPKSSTKEPPVASAPQGNVPKIGGPGSAFTPVKTNQSKTASFNMVTVASVTEERPSDVDFDLKEGDVLIEVNEQWVLCESLEVVTARLKTGSEDIYFIVARVKGQEKDQKAKSEVEENQKKDEEIEALKTKLGELQSEVTRKNKTIRDLTAVIPRKRIPGEKFSKQTVTKTTEINGNIVTTDIIVNGLADDEFIV